MYLKNLEIQGFKSFPEKIKLEFHQGITAVVGPNGSGKSNVSDAVRWVLGEQRAKSLRGDKMEDIIFAGTQNRRALGFAEVSLTLNNEDRILPSDYTEVRVTRRVYRSGESEYLINNGYCRLKDIYELFMDTGIGREGYSIIGQGKIEEILSNRSEDRRRLFEEAAGIVKYRTRRMEAEQKLEKERQNLQRVEDIIREIENNLKLLSHQSEKAKEYLRLRDRLRIAESALFVLEVDRLEQVMTKNSGDMNIVVQQLSDGEKKFDRDSQQLKQWRQKQELDTSKMQEISGKIINLRTELEHGEGNLRLLEEQKATIIQKIRSSLSKKDTLQEKKAHIQETIDLNRTNQDGLELSKQSLQKKLAMLEEKFQQMTSHLVLEESQLEDYKSDLMENMQQMAGLRESLSRSYAILEQFEERQVKLTEEISYLSAQVDTNRVHLAVCDKKQEHFTEEKEHLTVKKQQSDDHLCQLNQKLEELTEKDRILMGKYQEKQSRMHILSEMEKTHEGFFKSVRDVLRLKENRMDQWSGICGAVGELLQVDRNYETAIEVALGGALQNIVTLTEEDAGKAIDYLKKTHGGRATFLPISAVKGKEFSKEEPVLREEGVLGTAKNLIQFDKKYEGIFASLLGRTVVVSTRQKATALSRKYRQNIRLVTLEGELFSPGGAISGGSANKKISGIISRGREINDLKKELSSLEEEQDVLRQKGRKLREEQNKEQIFLTEVREKLQNISISEAALTSERTNTLRLIEEITEKSVSARKEQRQLTESLGAAKQETVQGEKELKDLEQVKSQLEGILSNAVTNLQTEKDEKNKLTEQMTALRMDLQTTEQNLSFARQEKKRLDQEMQQYGKEIDHLIEKCREEKFLLEKREETQKNTIDQITNLKTQLSEKNEELSIVTDSRSQCKDKIELLERKTREQMDNISHLKNEVFRLETKKARLEEERARLFQKIWDDYELTYSEAKACVPEITDEEKLQKEAIQRREAMKKLGTVNIDAIEEYQKAMNRHEFMIEQKEDIRQAEEKLRQIIAELSRRMEEQFREEFDIISKNFDLVFREMFGGGKAYLRLSDEEDILESGIEIIAQPPGKNLQNMSLLSGGERALTAIAILFAILKMKPSPFCILDEIEAALDDANVKRYAQYLKHFSRETQFIVITHRKGTMEAADILYGITMQEQGVSKVVSVDLRDKNAG